MLEDVVDISSIILTLMVLIVATYYDLKFREINPWLWVPFIAFGTVFTVYKLLLGVLDVIIIMFSLIAPLTTLLLTYVGLIGGADFLALLSIALLMPKCPDILGFSLLPPSLVILAYSVFIMVGISLGIAIINILLYRNELKRVPRRLRILYLFTALPLRVNTILNTKFWFLLEIPWENKFRATFDINEDPSKHREVLSKKLNERAIEDVTRIWSTWGIPHIALYFIGFLIFLALKDNILLRIITTII